MESVSLNQLKTVCNLYLEVEFPYFEELREAFFVLDICGCRIEELFQIERWAYVSGDIVTLWPQKNNLQRTIILNEHTQNFKNCIINQTKPFLGRTSYQLQYLFRKLNPYIPIYSGGREISLYCYRYKHIWEAQAAGFTIEEIRLEMGHRTQTPILLYLAAQINSTYYIEPTIEDPIPSGHIDIITNPIVLNGTNVFQRYTNQMQYDKFSYLIDFLCVSTSLRVLLSSDHLETSGYYFRLRTRYVAPYLQLYVQLGTTSAAYFHTYTLFLTPNVRHSFCYTFDQSNQVSISPDKRDIYIKLYVDGVLINTLNLINFDPAIGVNQSGLIGGESYNGTNPTSLWSGTIYRFYQWNKILSDSEISILHNLY